MVEDPILILDIKLVKDEPQKITIFEFDNPEDIVDQFCTKHSKYTVILSLFLLTFNYLSDLDEIKRERLLTVIKA